ncbi:hypothetical protein [Streptomyces sp. B21-083]|uniref:hypothetical protein n=1 Tax=Streptomyces sp. B21-083 TaxID=3039410 RepID=UPI002FF195D0
MSESAQFPMVRTSHGSVRGTRWGETGGIFAGIPFAAPPIGPLRLRADARYVDLWPVLADHRGGLRSLYTHDDLHLNGPGYRAWGQTLRPLLADVARGATKENSA